MNFDLQSAWDSDKGDGDEIKLPENSDRLKSAHLPLDAIRKNMRIELWLQILAVIATGFIPKLLNLLPLFSNWFYSIYLLFVGVSVYYLVKLYLFYKRISRFDNNTKDGLYEMYYDIRLTIETYRTFTFSLIPFVLAMTLLFLVGADQQKFADIFLGGGVSEQLILKTILVFIVAFGCVAIATEIHLNLSYLKHARVIKKLLNELKED